ncbi:TonB-dependent copper receptor [Endozoicomonas arenosclerae]|uniref:TonB-dependent copper receptor n=1 Tax=Endozoicomonas arenosclerae TaxID=1633495 RepID=UPI000B004868|nr:TonB-dependent copper receptor [Endozoicomonas arenosclerae]
MKYSFLCIGLVAPIVLAADFELDVDVTETMETPPSESMIKLDQPHPPVTDAGQLLRQETGVAVSRKGGKGFEPIIRGQQQSQLNIITADAFVLGACPGRMDPPTTYASLKGYDRVTVLRGYESVIYGSGGSGGTVLFERDAPHFNNGTEVRSYTGNIGARYTDNIDHKQAFADVSLGKESAYLRAYGEYQDAGNYKDGNGQTVSSAFRSNSGGILISGEIIPFTRLEANVESTRDDEVYYSGNGMDAPWAKADTWRLKLQHDQPFLGLDSIELSGWHADVRHLMDNYSVRLRKPNSPNGMRAPSDSVTWGGRLLGKIYYDDAELKLGVDYQANDRDANRYKVNRQTGNQVWQSHIWPGVEYRQMGVFAELDFSLSEKDSFRVGMRFDDLKAEATKASSSLLGNSSPNQLYQKYYGVEADKVHEQNLSGLLAWQHELSGDQSIELRGSRSVRTADTSERFIASRGSCCHGSDDWVGNPDIKPEKHQQLDAGYRYHTGAAEWSAIVYVDEVQDYILRTQSESGAYTYKNIEARLYGVETDVRYTLGRFKPSAGVAWTRGENRDNGSDLPQIPPLQFNLQLDYDAARWLVGARWELASKQEKVDTLSGLDTGQTDGYGVVHLHGWYHLGQGFKLEAGVQNLFDKAYAQHVNRASHDPFDPKAVRANEPGRELWVGVNYRF